MSRTARHFVLASLLYFLVGNAIGLLLIGWPGMSGVVRWPHLHVNLIGFVTFMIFGVAYHILPRFSGNPLWSDGMARVHFWLANIGLLGLVGVMGGQGFARVQGVPRLLPWIPLALGAGTIFFAGSVLFVGNLWMSMRPRTAAVPGPAAGPSGPASAGNDVRPVREDMSVGEVAERHPETLPVFGAHGMGKVRSAFFRKTVARHVSLGLAASKHGLEVGELVDELNDAIAGDGARGDENEGEAAARPDGDQPSSVAAAPPAHPPVESEWPRPPAGTSPTVDGPIGPDTRIGRVVERWPATRDVFVDHFGPGCFTCPAFETESVREATMMHGTPLGRFLDDLNRAATGCGPVRPDAPSGGSSGGNGLAISDRELSELIRDHPPLGPVLVDLGFDTCCGGDRSLAEAAREDAVDLDDALRRIRRAVAVEARPGG